jgi:hypothetical protein
VKRIASILLALPVAGCFSDQQRQVAACELEAMRLYRGEQLATSAGRMGVYITKCMQAHGYEQDTLQPACRTSFEMEADPYCYVPIGWGPRLLYRLETGSRPTEWTQVKKSNYDTARKRGAAM